MIDMVLDCGRRFLLMFIDQYFEKMINFLLLEIFVSILKVKKKGCWCWNDEKKLLIKGVFQYF